MSKRGREKRGSTCYVGEEQSTSKRGRRGVAAGGHIYIAVNGVKRGGNPSEMA
jgi:hypothetical protein